MQTFVEWLNFNFYGNPAAHWLEALVISVLFIAAVTIVRSLVIRRFAQHSAETISVANEVAITLARSVRPLAVIITAFYLGAQQLTLPAEANFWIGLALLFGLLYQTGLWGNTLIGLWLERYRARNLTTNPARVTTIMALGFVSRLLLFSLILLVALDSIPGVEVTALVASLGIGGIAAALALQSVLADFFSSLVISLDQPFVIGDFIVVGEFSGTVERIGIKTTRLRSLSGEQLIFSNSDMVNSRIRNFTRMAERRVIFSFGVTYETPYEKLQAIPTLVRELIEQAGTTRFDRAHFASYGDYALTFEVVYFVLSPDYNLYMDVQQKINLALYKRFADQGIEFAFPTRTVNIEGTIIQRPGS